MTFLNGPKVFYMLIWPCIGKPERIIYFFEPYTACRSTNTRFSTSEAAPLILFNQRFKLFNCVCSSSIGQMMNVSFARYVLARYFCPSSLKRATVYPNRFNMLTRCYLFRGQVIVNRFEPNSSHSASNAWFC